ncbi:MAG: NAD(P)/FAD-dependent oxidoreductase [Solirubrobacteraceae bacterium]|nr:NAD(P)/FAD-dependent oxidoreductase [Solirubrobacteraceae bacterium]
MPKIVIVGAGFGGIAAAVELRSHGFRDVTILDKAPEPGGTWFYNTYPGAACDVPSHLYSYSFSQRRDWDRLCPRQSDILAYIHDVVREQGLDDVIVGDSPVDRCAWDDETRRWTVTVRDGRTYDADAVVMATGQLHQPATPRLPGAESFAGHAFHSAEWDHDYDLRDKRVAVVGTGASAVQFVPEVAKEAAHLTVFQRSGNWFLPRKNRRYPWPWRKVIEHVPGVQALRRRYIAEYTELLTRGIRHPATLGRILWAWSTLTMRWQLRGDAELRRKVWPDYTIGCKRILFSSRFLPALRRPNVEVVTDAITGLAPEGVVTADGRTHEVDCVIYGTGFRTNDFMFPMEITGRDGLSLRDAWAGGPHAHLGITVPGFPSLFVMYGPNTNTSGGSIVTFLEAQAGYLRQALELQRSRDAAAVEVREDVEAASDRALQERFAGTAWLRCDSWYRNEAGRIVTNWPDLMKEYVAATRTLDPSEYEVVARPTPATAVPEGVAAD